MEIKLGNILLRIGKVSQAPLARLRIASGSETGIAQLFNRYDDPRENLTYIRETVAAAMHARSEAIGKGRFRIYETTRSNGKEVQREFASDHDLMRLLDSPIRSSMDRSFSSLQVSGWTQQGMHSCLRCATRKAR
jgi:hypothetical protein